MILVTEDEILDFPQNIKRVNDAILAHMLAYGVYAVASVANFGAPGAILASTSPPGLAETWQNSVPSAELHFCQVSASLLPAFGADSMPSVAKLRAPTY